MTHAHECFRCGHRCECGPGNRGSDCEGCGRCDRSAWIDSWFGVTVAAVLLGALVGMCWVWL
jgi:hypothetical protein